MTRILLIAAVLAALLALHFGATMSFADADGFTWAVGHGVHPHGWKWS